MTERYLVTGGAGFVGSHLTERLGADVLDRPDDINRIVPWKYDVIFHLAATVGVDYTQTHPGEVIEDIEGIKNVLKTDARVVFTSSSEIYGNCHDALETDSPAPLSPYAMVKALGEELCRARGNFVVARLFNTYGPRQRTDFVIPRFIESAKTDKDIVIYGDGEQTRTYCYVDDTVEALARCAELKNETINIGHTQEVNLRELGEMIIRMTDSRSEIVYKSGRQGEITRRQPNNDKMKRLLGRELISLSDGLRKMI